MVCLRCPAARMACRRCPAARTVCRRPLRRTAVVSSRRAEEPRPSDVPRRPPIGPCCRLSPRSVVPTPPRLLRLSACLAVLAGSVFRRLSRRRAAALMRDTRCLASETRSRLQRLSDGRSRVQRTAQMASPPDSRPPCVGFRARLRVAVSSTRRACLCRPPSTVGPAPTPAPSSVVLRAPVCRRLCRRRRRPRFSLQARRPSSSSRHRCRARPRATDWECESGPAAVRAWRTSSVRSAPRAQPLLRRAVVRAARAV